jgi:hypothetical protein
MPGIKKLEKGEFLRIEVGTPTGLLGLVIAASPPNIAPIPTTKCNINRIL